MQHPTRGRAPRHASVRRPHGRRTPRAGRRGRARAFRIARRRAQSRLRPGAAAWRAPPGAGEPVLRAATAPPHPPRAATAPRRSRRRARGGGPGGRGRSGRQPTPRQPTRSHPVRGARRRSSSTACAGPSRGSGAAGGAPTAAWSPARRPTSGSLFSTRRQHVRDVVARERAAAGEHLVEHDAEGPDVGALVDGLAARLLGRHVGRRAEDHAHLRRRGPSASASSARADALPEPAPAGSSALARPKSSTFTVPSARTLMFAGFRSRWTMPCSCAASSASAICLAIGSASASGSAPARDDRCDEVLALDQFHHERVDVRGLILFETRRSGRCSDDSARRASAPRA